MERVKITMTDGTVREGWWIGNHNAAGENGGIGLYLDPDGAGIESIAAADIHLIEFPNH